MADIADNMTMARWLRAKVDNIIDLSDDFIFATLLSRGIDDDETLLADVTERQRDLCLADVYFNAAISSSKSGTQGESDGGWTHYIANKNVVNRDGLLRMAKRLYDKWDEPFDNPASNPITLKGLY
ncbi:MAG: hypothetical protein J5382_10360 [Bacteroidales bacterium]|nr:hypothetical protein [Bacteroidales bacterium]